jgi:hypothetical protein
MKDLLKQICARHGLNIEAFGDELIDCEGTVKYFATAINALVELYPIDQAYRVWGPDNELMFSGTWTSTLS